MALFGVPVNFLASIQHGWKMGKTVCNVTGFLLTLEGKSEILTSTLKSFSFDVLCRLAIKSCCFLLESFDERFIFLQTFINHLNPHYIRESQKEYLIEIFLVYKI